jgi:transglutaminase-like putative cysteine protease
LRPRIFLFLLLFPAVLQARGARDFSVAPPPVWVERVPVDVAKDVPREHVRWGIYDVLDDHQAKVGSRGAAHYHRTVRKVLSPSGVQNASELSIDFDPTFESLTLHEATIIRDGARINALEPDEVRVLEKEDDSGQRIYDGELTAMIFLADVRPGDTIEYAWSISGDNPLLAGKVVDELDLSSGVPTRHIRHRLILPAGRAVRWKGAKPSITTIGNEQVVIWERRDVPALDVEDEIPTWFEPWESVQLSEFASWSEVARWADALFVLDERSKKEVQTLAARLRAEQKTDDERITAAIRFVQDDIRYLGIEMGRNSHEPHQPWETLTRRWGDCKDKALLLAALLRELGLEAYPALVNTRLRHRIADRLPSPFLFDHVIVQVVRNGATYWVDGTISDQGGTLEMVDTPSDGHALLVRGDATALTKIAAPPSASTLIVQTYTTVKYSEPTRLEVESTYTGSDADSVRGMLASMSMTDLAKERLNRYAADGPKIEADGKLTVTDDRVLNKVVIAEKYRIRDFWQEGGWTWYPRAVERHIHRPDTMIRSMPLAFEYPLNITQRVTINLPERLDIESTRGVTESPAFRHEYDVDSNGKAIHIRQTLRALRDHVTVAEVPDHLAKLNGVWGEIGYHLNPAIETTESAAETVQASMAGPAGMAKWIGGATAIGVFIGICVLIALPRRRRRARQFAQAASVERFGPGEAPASAFAVRHPYDIERHLASRNCRCGAAIAGSGETSRARYGDREMTIVVRQCARCGQEQSLYFAATSLVDTA